MGIADGAAGNWGFVEQHMQRQLIGFLRVTEYGGKIAQARYPQRNAEDKRAHWQKQRCHQLKHDPEAPAIPSSAKRPAPRAVPPSRRR